MIEKILNFIVENYQFIMVIILCLITFFLSIFKKNVKVQDSIVLDIISKLPVLICKAENILTASKSGASKKLMVLDAALLIYKKMTGVELSYDSDIAHQIDEAIENILSTPQKKGE